MILGIIDITTERVSGYRKISLQRVRSRNFIDYYIWVGPLHLVISIKTGGDCHGTTKLYSRATESPEGTEDD